MARVTFSLLEFERQIKEIIEEAKPEILEQRDQLAAENKVLKAERDTYKATLEAVRGLLSEIYNAACDDWQIWLENESAEWMDKTEKILNSKGRE